MKQPNFAAMSPVVAKAIEQMMAEQGDKFSLEKVNLAELKRRTGISRARLRRMNTPPETVPLDRTNGAARPLKWCMVTADMVH